MVESWLRWWTDYSSGHVCTQEGHVTPVLSQLLLTFFDPVYSWLQGTRHIHLEHAPVTVFHFRSAFNPVVVNQTDSPFIFLLAQRLASPEPSAMQQYWGHHKPPRPQIFWESRPMLKSENGRSHNFNLAYA